MKYSIRILLLFFLLSCALLFFKFPQMLFFDADQEFYANQYLHIFRDHKLTLLGIGTSTGGLFVGPLYTYFTSIVYWVFHGDPVGISLATLVFSSLQAGCTYVIFSKIKNEKVGLYGGILVLISGSLWQKAFAASPINFLYPFGLYFFYLLTQLHRKSVRTVILLAVLLGLSFHIHVSLFFFLPLTFGFFVWQRSKDNQLWRNFLIIFLGVIIFLSPFILFHLRHNFFVSHNLVTFLQNSFSTQSSKLQHDVFAHSGLVILTFYSTIAHILIPVPAVPVGIFLSAVLIYFLFSMKKEEMLKTAAYIIGMSLLLFFFYHGPMPDYYFLFIMAPVIFVVAQFLECMEKIPHLKLLSLFFILFLFWQNMIFISRSYNPYSFFVKQSVSRYIKENVGGKPVKVIYDTDLGLGYGFSYLYA